MFVNKYSFHVWLVSPIANFLVKPALDKGHEYFYSSKRNNCFMEILIATTHAKLKPLLCSAGNQSLTGIVQERDASFISACGNAENVNVSMYLTYVMVRLIDAQSLIEMRHQTRRVWR